MSTTRLFDQDSYRYEFDSVVVGQSVINDKQGVILDATLFYPLAGGQPCDNGTLNGRVVLDVYEVNNGNEIVHIMEEPLENGEIVRGSINFKRRFDHMQQHTGQHILSAVFMKLFKAVTVGFHLGDLVSTLDVSVHFTDAGSIEAVETAANQAVVDNRKIICKYVDYDTFCSLPLRKKPPEMAEIRLVNIEDFDWSACCGTHLGSTGEAGLIKIINFEKHKEGTRLTFVCGARALQDCQKKSRLLAVLCRKLTVGESEFFARIEGLIEEQSNLKKQLKVKQVNLLKYEVDDLCRNAELRENCKLITDIFNDRSPKDLQQLVRTICKQDNFICICGLEDVRGTVIIGKSANIDQEINILKDAAERVLTGRGGGNKFLTQTSGVDPAKVEAAVRAAIAALP